MGPCQYYFKTTYKTQSLLQHAMQPGQIIKNLIPSEPVTLNHIQPLGTMVSVKFTGVNTKRTNTKVISVSEFEQLEVLAEVLSILREIPSILPCLPKPNVSTLPISLILSLPSIAASWTRSHTR
ncbi:hypothetical protein GCM10027275_47060 [Rhabdobacter roseus]